MRFATLADWLAWQESLHHKPIDLGLERVRRVFDALDGPPAPFTITVGGTNGKGSCVALLTAILRAAGYRVGTYTSPHLLRYNERIQVDGTPVDDARIQEAFERIDRVRGDTTLSYFEFGTLAALDIFRRARLDIQVLEVGLGGRLDAVNILDADAALVASIDVDHAEWLGGTREVIALEKAGIFRSRQVAVLGDPDPPECLLAETRSRGVRLTRQGRDFRAVVRPQDWDWCGSVREETHLPFPALVGAHQFLNAAAVLELLSRIGGTLPVSRAAFDEGLRGITLAGRFQEFPGDPPLVLDVAHNPQAARSLAQMVRARFADVPVSAVFAILRDKDVVGVLDAMMPLVDSWHLAPLALPRALPVERVAEVLTARGGCARICAGYRDVASAIAGARRAGRPVVVFGSFFLVSESLAQLAPLAR